MTISIDCIQISNVLKSVSHTVTQTINHFTKNLTSLFPFIFLSKHLSMYALGKLKWILDIIWPLNQHFKLKKSKKLAKTTSKKQQEFSNRRQIKENLWQNQVGNVKISWLLWKKAKLKTIEYFLNFTFARFLLKFIHIF